MAEYGGYQDPFASTQDDVGSTTAIGNTMVNPNDPLIDWASNLSKDDLARFLHDPQGTAADLAAKGIPPPPMDHVHNYNESVGTPSRSTRFLSSAQDPTGLSPQAEAKRGIEEQRARSAVGGPQMPASASAYSDIPLKPEEQGSNPIIDKMKENFKKSGTVKPYAPGEQPGTPPILRPNPPPKPEPPPDLRDWRHPPPHPPGMDESTSPLDPQTQPQPQEKKSNLTEDQNRPVPEEEKTYNPSTPEGRKNITDKLSDLGKAMQGVKAPEPLKPPPFAPSPGRPSPVNAPNVNQLLGMLSGAQSGQVPASVMPVLRLMGR